MPRAARPDRTRRSYSLPVAIVADLEDLADELDMNPSVLVGRALEYYLPEVRRKLEAAR